MKLIDLDEIEYFTLVDKDGTPRFRVEIGDGLPIVKAITIEWIHNYLDNTFLPEGQFWAIQKMIKRWEKENADL